MLQPVHNFLVLLCLISVVVLTYLLTLANALGASGSGWKVIPVGATSVGTVRDYTPIRETIKNLERTKRYNKEAKA